MPAELSCRKFTDFLARRCEHLDDDILRDITPIGTWIGKVSTGTFPTFAGVSHTFDRFRRVWPDVSGCWSDVEDVNCISGCGSGVTCVGTPCDPTETKICFGFDRDTYTLQQKSYATDLLCFDQILSADRAKEQFSQIIENLREATNHIVSERLKTEAFLNAGFHWAAGANFGTTNGAFTYPETCLGTVLTPSVLPTSKLTVNMLRRRVQPQMLAGAFGKNPQGRPPMLELVTDMDTLWDLVQGNSELSDKWRFQDFDTASQYYKYGWSGSIGNYAVRVDPYPMRWQWMGAQLQRVYPYENNPATCGIGGDINQQYVNAPVQASFIHHVKAMQCLVLDATSINPLMPFAARDFGGKWQFVMDNLTCGTVNVDTDNNTYSCTIPVAVDNSRRNKGKFIADFKFATKPMYVEFEEVILHLREQPCIVEIPPCDENTDYVTQDYNSECDPCDDEECEEIPQG